MPDEPDQLTPELRASLRIIADTLPMLESRDFTPGVWHDSWQRPDGVIVMPWFESSPQADEFRAAVGRSGLLQMAFAWPDWTSTPEAIALRTDREALARATPDQLGKLLTMLIREDRFNEGALAESFESGLIAAVARRSGSLADEGSPPQNPSVADQSTR
jgi:hypothetical protein